MKRVRKFEYEGHEVHLGYSTKYKHYKVQVGGKPAGWVIPGTCSAYDDNGELLGVANSIETAAYFVAENYVYS